MVYTSILSTPIIIKNGEPKIYNVYLPSNARSCYKKFSGYLFCQQTNCPLPNSCVKIQSKGWSKVVKTNQYGYYSFTIPYQFEEVKIIYSNPHHRCKRIKINLKRKEFPKNIYLIHLF